MKREMARSGAGVKKSVRLFRRVELAGRRVEAIDHYLVAPQVCGERKPIGTVQLDAVGVWTFLLLAWAGALVLLDVDHRTKTAISANRQHGNGSAAVVRDEQVLAFTVEAQMTRIRPF